MWNYSFHAFEQEEAGITTQMFDNSNMQFERCLLRNAITASKSANCVDFTGCHDIIPIFHSRKHRKSTTNDNDAANNEQANNYSGE